MEISTVYIVSDEVLVGVNPEMADMGNPEGRIFRKKFLLEALTEEGRRFRHRFSFEKRPEVLLSRVLATGKINLDHWIETYEVYGSKAWQEEDAAREAAWQSNPDTKGTVRDY